MIKIKRNEVETADGCCQPADGARGPRGMRSLWAVSFWVPLQSLTGMDSSSAHTCQSCSLNPGTG